MIAVTKDAAAPLRDDLVAMLSHTREELLDGTLTIIEARPIQEIAGSVFSYAWLAFDQDNVAYTIYGITCENGWECHCDTVYATGDNVDAATAALIRTLEDEERFFEDEAAAAIGKLRELCESSRHSYAVGRRDFRAPVGDDSLIGIEIDELEL